MPTSKQSPFSPDIAEKISGEINDFIDVLRLKYGADACNEHLCLMAGVVRQEPDGTPHVLNCGYLNGPLMPAVAALSFHACGYSSWKQHKIPYSRTIDALITGLIRHLRSMEMDGEEGLDILSRPR